MKGVFNAIKGFFTKEAIPNNKGSVKLLHPKEDGKKVVAVVVSFVSGATYDSLFISIKPQAE